jgi:UDP-2,4-diacetamido-2,4,6-trideoxy-beta-L-altropyranose hydrolase
MSIAFRADASDTIGNGHIMRCITLADQLTEQGEDCIFICRTVTDPAHDAIRKAGHRLHMLPAATSQNDRPMPHHAWLSSSWQEDAAQTQTAIASAEWVVVDHYGIDASWEAGLRIRGTKVAVIDDLADRPHDCDLILDQNLHTDPHAHYEKLIPQHAQKLFGPRFVLLRPEFERERQKPKPKSENILVAFSGADPLHLTKLAVQVLQGHRAVTVVVNRQNVDFTEIQKACEANHWHFHVDANNLAALMQRATIGIGAGGGMLWERAAVGLPSIAIIVAENQRQQVASAQAANLVLGLQGEGLDAQELHAAIERMKSDDALRAAMSNACLRLVDGKGRKRVAERLSKPDITLRPATTADSENIWHWRNDERIRRYSRNADPIAWEAHQQWFAHLMQDRSKDLLLASDTKGPLGVVRFDANGQDKPQDSREVSIYLVPDRLGEGRGASLLLAAENWLAKKAARQLHIHAETLAHNTASIDLFRSCGYILEQGMFVKSIGSSS